MSSSEQKAGEKTLSRQEVYEFARSRASAVKGPKLLAIIPDKTRSGGGFVGSVLIALYDELAATLESFTALIALGTHGEMSREAIAQYLGLTPDDLQSRPKLQFANHEWRDQSKLETIGTLTREALLEISGGRLDLADLRLAEGVPVEVNHRVVEADDVVIIGPTLPHEVVGCSGGNKYFFPGCSGPRVTGVSHWLGACVTIPHIIGRVSTPVRELVNHLAAMISKPRKHCFSLVPHGEVLHGIFFGTPEEAYLQAAKRTLEVNAKYVTRRYSTVLALCSPKYPEIWTAGKCSYKLAQVVEPGGRLIIYGPQIKQVSESWGEAICRVGYHTLPYIREHFQSYLDAQVPLGVLAHVTHVKGTGRMENGREVPDMDVIMASGLSEKQCRDVNLGYLDYHSLDIESFRRDPDCLVVEDAGETLYLVRE